MMRFLGASDRGDRRVRLAVTALVVAFGLLAAPSAALALTDYTWTGTDASTNPKWSDGANWGGTAPSGTVGTLTFPAVSGSACPMSGGASQCLANNDLTANSLTASGLSITDDTPYDIYGNAINLGSGGITATPSGTGSGVAQFSLPLALTANQTWSIAGQLQLFGAVTGGTSNLGITFTGTRPRLRVFNDVEVGPITASGAGTVLLNQVTGMTSSQGSLNGSNGHAVSFSGGAGLVAFSPNTAVGPLTMSGGQVQVGQGSIPDGNLSVNGSGTVTLDSASSLTMFIDQVAATPGSYSQLFAGGNVNLGGAPLHLVGPSAGNCPTLHVGDIYHLVESAHGHVSGTFAGIPDGTVIPLDCATGTPPNVQINYGVAEVTATVVGSSTTTHSLSVSKAGSGVGTVSSSPAGINCGSTCSASFNAGSSVTLTAVPNSGSTFTGWSGAGCSGTGTCTVTMSANQAVTANFAAKSSSGPGGNKKKCVVPKLKGKTLKNAKKALKKAHCRLGKVKGRKKGGHVKKQGRKRGKVLPAGTKISLKLG